MAFVFKTLAKIGDPRNSKKANVPAAPGAARSPQIPGEVPDRSSVPEHGQLPVALPVGPVERPLVEYGTAQGVMHVYAAKDGNDRDPMRFEQAPPSYQEMRKPHPELRTPVRPTPGYALAAGVRIASPQLAQLAANADTAYVER